MTSYKIFTICSGKVEAGTNVGDLTLKGAGTTIPAIIIGEEGRGRSRGVLPVDFPPLIDCPDQGKDVWASGDSCVHCKVALGPKEDGKYTRVHPREGKVRGRLLFAALGQTKAGKPKFLSQPQAKSDEFIFAVMLTTMGFRGSNSHTGDRTGETEKDYWGKDIPKFAKFPGEVIVEGNIAQGDAGRMGSGMQLVAKIPKGVVFRTAYSGRLYGRPSSHYYKWDGNRVLSATWEERAAADLF